MNTNVKEIALRLFQLALLAGIVGLAYYDKDGWGWLIFILLCTI
jgi:hypothetical protein